ncbi:MAG: DUF3267 domain-containing protein [Clostridia bacterium]|nr:DUF3267 domain-containing protein [Clostridia bacterium]
MPKISQSDRIAKRKKNLQNLSDQLTANGYTRSDLIVSAKTANTYATLSVLPFITVYAVAFGLIVGWRSYTDVDFGLLGISILLSLVIHELIHGFFFSLFAEGKFRSVEFGVLWKSFNPYCYCGDPVRKTQYLIALTMPGIILGALVGAIAIAVGSATWLIFSLVAFLSASGDFLIALKILIFGKRGNGGLFQDHPDQPGVVVFTKEQ